MSTIETDSEVQEELSEDKQDLLQKLSTVFDREKAEDIVCPKLFEIKKHLTLDDIKHVNYDENDNRIRRLRSLAHYETTTRSLPRTDLEESYQAFIRSQLNRPHVSREQLELFVRNSSDIDVAQRFIEFSQEISTHPLQPHLLFHSSKLNEQRANLLKSASTHKSLKDMNDDLSLHEFFPEIFTSHSKSALKPKEILRAKSPIQSRPRSIHIEHRDRKYRITFLKDSNQVQSFPKLARYGPATNENLALMTHRNHQSLFGTDSSTVQGLSTSTTTTAKIHREIFPPLSLAALREYRPTLTPKVSPIQTTTTIRPSQQQTRHKDMLKTDFIWEQSIVTPKT